MNKKKDDQIKDLEENHSSGGISKISIEFDMKKSYSAYAGSVIIGRALPDLRDGLKPVHRRILYAMYQDGVVSNKPHTKSASVVGDVMKKFHPHGDASIYDAMVRLAQDFVMSVPLIDGQGNFGSVDGDMAASMRYTEARMAKITDHLMADIEKNTVDFRDNYNAAYKEPTVLPAVFPNLLVNGSSGVAVGMATNIPPFNFNEVLDSCIFLLKNKEAKPLDILKIIKGPDFPTGGLIVGSLSSIRNAMLVGRGTIINRGVAEIEKVGSREQIVISEIPYQVNKARLIEKIIELIKEKKLDGISDIRDESSYAGIRIVIEIKRDSQADIVLNRLFKFTQLQESFGVNMMMIHGMRPVLMPIFDVLRSFLEFRRSTIIRRFKFELEKLRNKIHILIGLAAATLEIDKAIQIIRNASDVSDAREKLLSEKWSAGFLSEIQTPVEKEINVIDSEGKLSLTEEQVKAILDLRLHRLTKLEKNKLIDEINNLSANVQECLILLNYPEKLDEFMINEFENLNKQFVIPRRTKIVETNLDDDIESLIENEDVAILVTNNGYIKRVPLDSYRTQARGGKGRGSGNILSDEDSISQLITTDTHSYILFFFDTGLVYKTKVYKIPEGDPTSRGRSVTNLFSVDNSAKIKKVIVLPSDESLWGEFQMMFITANGNVRRNNLEDFRNIPANGKIAIRFDEIIEEESDDKQEPGLEDEKSFISSRQDYLVDVCLCKSIDHILIATNSGKAVRFPITAVRIFKSRTSNGVRAIRLIADDYVVSASILGNAEFDNIIKRDQYLSLDYDFRKNLLSLSEEEFSEVKLPENLTLLNLNEIKEFSKTEELVLAVTENGFGKLTSAYDYRVTNRGGSGVTNILTSKRNGGVVASFVANFDDTIMLITDKGQIIRIPVSKIRISGRNTQGVTLFKLGSGERVSRATKVIETEVVLES
jgi:DNA gyrase subunit A